MRCVQGLILPLSLTTYSRQIVDWLSPLLLMATVDWSISCKSIPVSFPYSNFSFSSKSDGSTMCFANHPLTFRLPNARADNSLK